MNFEVLFLDLAELDLDDIAAYLLQYSPNAATRFFDALEEQMLLLCQYPRMCPVYRWDENYRRAIVDKFSIFYQIDEEAGRILVFRVLHSSRNIQNELK